MNFSRINTISRNIVPKRVLVVYGPRRVGKTTSLEHYLETQNNIKIFSSVGDDIKIRELFNSEDKNKILDFARPFNIIAIDEAQNIEKIGIGVKMIIDAFPDKNIILTGSSSFNLSQGISEPLTGRHFVMNLFPIAQSEIQLSKFELKNKIEDFLIFGLYPEILITEDKELKKKILNELISSYLFKDILILDKIKSPDLLLDITRCLAFQIGSEVSYGEIAKTVKTDTKTVQRYIDVLEKMFVIKRVRGFSRNLRNEISKKSKFYFYDTGVRNAVISQFMDIQNRNDIGALWENFIFMELYKKSSLENKFDNFYFWRTHTGEEIDIIIESEGKLIPIECKWSKDKIKVPKKWIESYDSEEIKIINKDNYLEEII
jgi:uncharacterized protein